ncbi:helix-turn-helix transcriptional regulator [Aurantimonas sp. Leaf443]|uniref:helix-turn-helix domain-containing protein n=1 Tax=Aurantimonas sp. Leaf443 TaxID=1736378 RepID=UPI0006F63649|nr:helix-turn-helix transcriptional regulator [Aurantimonas sp. Leaf443]KQT83934.1 Cro/Cl family transcriptional regulator [Aurantimonas sp. Leaf443]
MVENKKKPNPIDQHVGSRVRLRRTMLGMSQEKLGESLGITFQQIQKYEKGSNRIGASRLQRISEVLNVPVSYFFEDAPGSGGAGGLHEPAAPDYVADFLSSSEGLQLTRAFIRISDPKVRRRIIDLVKSFADAAEADSKADAKAEAKVETKA